jgi:hypothetical protein
MWVGQGPVAELSISVKIKGGRDQAWVECGADVLRLCPECHGRSVSTNWRAGMGDRKTGARLWQMEGSFGVPSPPALLV